MSVKLVPTVGKHSFLGVDNWTKAQMDFGPGPLLAKYQMNKNTFIKCCIEVVGANAEEFKARLGIHSPGDTMVPIGTRVYLYTQAMNEALCDKDEFELFYVTVHGIQVDNSLPVQVCSAIMKEFHQNRRNTPRTTAQSLVQMPELGHAEFEIIGGNLGGLTLVYNSAQLFIGLMLGKQYHLSLDYEGKTVYLPVELIHILYDWHGFRHEVGVNFLNLDDQQLLIVRQLLNLSATTALEFESHVDVDATRIRQNN